MMTFLTKAFKIVLAFQVALYPLIFSSVSLGLLCYWLALRLDFVLGWKTPHMTGGLLLRPHS